MWPILLLTSPLLSGLLVQAQNGCVGHSTFRSPTNSDMEVLCGSHTIGLHILLCPVYFSGYNESLLALNSQHSKDECKGTADWSADPPVVKFSFAMSNQGISACSNTLTVSQEAGTGLFSDFSNVQHIHISGSVCSKDPDSGAITYHQEVMYRFSCHYPLQYLVNNTHMSVAGANLAVRENNGSFISTLSMSLFSDKSYSSTLQIPAGGLELKTRIFVEVKASNLSSRFNVLLDRCYATTSLFPINTTLYNLFVGCNRDGQTVIKVNGEQQEARFSFEAFRFVQSHEALSSTYYIHCATRLCDSSFCPTLIQNCSSGHGGSRRRRAVGSTEDTTVSETATITSGPISVRPERGHPGAPGGSSLPDSSGAVLGISLLAAVVGAVCVTLVAFIVYQKFTGTKSGLVPQD